MNRPFNNGSFVLQRAQPLKFRMVPVSVGFWYQPHVTFFAESTLTFKSKKAKLPLKSSSSMVNCKIGCNLLAASRTNPGLPLTVLTMSSTYLRKNFNTIHSPICFLLFFACHAIYCFSDVCVFKFRYFTIH